MVTHVFFDIGGVLGTNGWSTAQRAAARAHFGLDPAMEARHAAVVEAFESGQMPLDAYLDAVVFDRPQAFSREAFVGFMQAQSRPHPEVLALVRRLREATPGLRLGTMNNESDLLNRHRIEAFGLRGLMDVFGSSCWLGAFKPHPAFFDRALAVAGAEARTSVFVDDRAVNVEAGRAAGLDAVHFDGTTEPAANLAAALAARGLRL